VLNSASFVEGFKVGALMMIEIFKEKEETPNKI
jgi:hypothetical protein